MNARLALILTLLCVTVAIPVSAAPAKAKAKKSKPAAKKPAPKTPAAKAPVIEDAPFISSIKQIPNGPGVFIAEPFAPAGSEAVAAFGAGCGRWLHLVVGGQP